MMIPSIEIIDAKGDTWIIRECEDDGCTVVEYCMVGSNGDEIKFQYDDAYECRMECHIPTASVNKLALGLQAWGKLNRLIGKKID